MSLLIATHSPLRCRPPTTWRGGRCSSTCGSHQDGEREAQQEEREDQDEVSLGQGVEPHGSQPVRAESGGSEEVRVQLQAVG